MKSHLARAAVEVGFIIFLFYSNLLMGEYERSGGAHTRGLFWALAEIFTPVNFGIGLFSAIVGFVAFELLRMRL